MRSLLHRLAIVAVAVIVFAAVPGYVSGEGGGLIVSHTNRISPRLEELRLWSPALQREASVRILTPSGFDPERDHLPVLWLLHGGFGSARDWTDAGDAEELTEGLPLIVVMPDAGIGGWYADWKRVPLEGPQNWETFHLDELRPFIEERYQTRTDRHGRAVAGLSMGGFGAMRYASLHPDRFGFAASFSGAVDILHLGVSVVVTISPLAHWGLPDGVFGNRVLDEATWRASNPVDLAEKLRNVEVQIRTGNGFPPEGGFDLQEYGVWQASTTLHNRLNELGIGHVFDVGPGGHNFTVWREALRKTLPGVVAHAADHPPHL